MAMETDLDAFKDIPGYKAILKSVLKSQIQHLMQQLSAHTGEESIVLTASVDDGSLSHLGSTTGKGFLEGREEIKSQFLGYCLKTFHKQKTQEESTPYQRTHPSPRASSTQPPSMKHARFNPIGRSTSINAQAVSPLNKHSQHLTAFSSSFSDTTLGATNVNVSLAEQNTSDHNETIKTESDGGDVRYDQSESLTTPTSYGVPPTVYLPHTQTNQDLGNPDGSFSNNETTSDSIKIKVETNDEEELEITGIEMGPDSEDLPADSSFNTSGNMGSYSFISATFDEDEMVDSLGHTQSPMTKKFACKICGNRFRTKQNLVKHTRIHTGERPFKCPYCSKAFRQKHHAEGHVISHHTNF